MADDVAVTYDYSAKETIAFKLLNVIMNNRPNDYAGKADILSLYSECLLATRDPQGYLGGTYKNILTKTTAPASSGYDR